LPPNRWQLGHWHNILIIRYPYNPRAAKVGYWHFSDIPLAPMNVRYWG